MTLLETYNEEKQIEYTREDVESKLEAIRNAKNK